MVRSNPQISIPGSFDLFPLTLGFIELPSSKARHPTLDSLICRRQKLRWPSGLGGLLKSEGDPKQFRFFPRSSKKRNAYGQTINHPSRHGYAGVTRHGGGCGAVAQPVI